VFVPAGTPSVIVNRLHSETLKAMQHTDVKNYVTREGAEAVGSSPVGASKFFLREVEKYAMLVKAAQVKPDSRQPLALTTVPTRHLHRGQVRPERGSPAMLATRP
jgi:hypothetical protein